jgi:hypothetical protein
LAANNYKKLAMTAKKPKGSPRNKEDNKVSCPKDNFWLLLHRFLLALS